MSGSNCCFLTCIQISQEAGKVVCYSHLLENIPQLVIYTVKGFGVINKALSYLVFKSSMCMVGGSIFLTLQSNIYFAGMLCGLESEFFVFQQVFLVLFVCVCVRTCTGVNARMLSCSVVSYCLWSFACSWPGSSVHGVFGARTVELFAKLLMIN